MDAEIQKLVDRVNGPAGYLEKMLQDRGPIADINFGDAPVHYNPGDPPGNKGIDWETGILLCNFVEAYKPKQIVELGTFRGYSTSWLILGTLLNGMGRVDAFEVMYEGGYGSMWYKEYNLPLDRFQYHTIPGGIWRYQDQIPESIDLLFHDTAHLAEPTKKEMEILLPRIPVGGIVLIDDVLHTDYVPMWKVLQNVFYGDSFGSWLYKILPLGHGLGIAKRIR